MPGLYTSQRIRIYGRKCSESKARNVSEGSACWGRKMSLEGLPATQMCSKVLCI